MELVVSTLCQCMSLLLSHLQTVLCNKHFHNCESQCLFSGKELDSSILDAPSLVWVGKQNGQHVSSRKGNRRGQHTAPS